MWDEIFHDARRLLANLLDVEAPVIGAVNGKASVHAELALLSDVVLAAESAVFQDAPHFRRGTVPGDGVHVIWPHLIGPTRARYFLMTGQKLTAEDGLRLGFVNEVLPQDRLLGRAWELARELARQPDLTLRYTRAAFTRQIKRMLHEDLGTGTGLLGGAVLLPAGFDGSFVIGRRIPA
jgi:enoyl-CoA hydratase/carnithine racemase